ncbi:hypothetical protein [Granulicella sp. WH15]|nr:hypothetical protein [Granulicella sp. WH15]
MTTKKTGNGKNKSKNKGKDHVLAFVLGDGVEPTSSGGGAGG